MFLKILKNDFKYYSKGFSAIILSVLLYTILSIIYSISDNFTVKSLLSGLIPLSFAASILGTFVSVINCFKRKFTTTECYLTYTLPVKKSHHLLSNLINSTIWSGIVFIEGFICLSIIKPIDNNPFNTSIFDMLYFDISYKHILLVSQIVLIILLTYLCININQLINLRKFKFIPGAILFFVAFYLEFYAIIGIDTLLFKLNMNNVHNDIIFLILFILLSLIFYFCNLYLMNKKIDIE